MIAKQAGEVGDVAYLLHHCVGVWPIAHKIAKTPRFINSSRFLQNCLKRGVICMNIRHHQNSHTHSKSLAVCSMIFSAASALLRSGKISFFPSANNIVMRFVSTANPASFAEMSFAAMKSKPLDLNFSEAF